jgi:hypothetical protein
MSGMGRSTPLVNLFIEYIRQGNGALFLDPHGDAADPAAPAFAVNYPSPPYTIPIATKTASPRDAVFVCGSPKPRDKPSLRARNSFKSHSWWQPADSKSA